jgi:[NiFe] hydrogenase diaphorase moiety small subunit
MIQTFMLDGLAVPFEDGQTIMEAAIAAGHYIPHLCYHPDFTPYGSCKLCNVNVDGKICAACTFPAMEGQTVISESEEQNTDRQRITQMLFVEGNHFCPSCEKSGNCQLQGIAYHLKMTDDHFNHQFPHREIDASHPDILIDFNRCIFCALCVRASLEEDGKSVFAISGRGINKRLIINSDSGQLHDSELTVYDRAAHICPTGAILIKHTAYEVPIGERQYDHHSISEVSMEQDSSAS